MSINLSQFQPVGEVVIDNVAEDGVVPVQEEDTIWQQHC
jgi:hypothetical protein